MPIKGSVVFYLKPQPISEGLRGGGFGQLVGFNQISSGDSVQACLWPTSSGNLINLNPTAQGYTDSGAYGTNGSQQVGDASGGPGMAPSQDAAFLWNGTADSAVNLNPAFLGTNYSSLALGTDGVQQVGEGFGDATDGQRHAVLWKGTAASAVDLNPTSLGIINSTALSVNGTQQVGSGYTDGAPTNGHALLWTGTAASAVDLHPTTLSNTFASSTAVYTNGSQQVGSAYATSLQLTHALLWNGTAATAVDLSPTNLSGICSSSATGTNGMNQVGYGSTGNASGPSIALLWSGTADSTVNLHALLPADGTWNDSSAISIDASGTVFGTANGTYCGVTGTFAVQWLVPSSVLFTSPIAVPTANAKKLRVMINVLNASSTPRTGTLQIHGLGGNMLSNVAFTAVAPGGGTGDEIIVLPVGPQITLLYGRVTVDEKADSIRASILIADDAGQTLVSVEAR